MRLSATLAPSAPMDDPFLFRGDFARTIPKAARLGYDGVELQMSDPADHDMRGIHALCRENGLALSSFGTGSNREKHGLTLTAGDAEVRAKAVECINRYTDAAAEWGAVVIIGLIKGQTRDCASPALFGQLLEDSLDQCLRYARPKGVTLAVEAINRFESDNIHTLAQAAALADRLGHPNLKVHMDTFQMNIEEANPLGAMAATGRRIGHVHVAENTGGPPGTGALDLGACAAMLAALGYGGWVALECLPIPTEEEAARVGLAHMRRLAAEIEGKQEGNP